MMKEDKITYENKATAKSKKHINTKNGTQKKRKEQEFVKLKLKKDIILTKSEYKDIEWVMLHDDEDITNDNDLANYIKYCLLNITQNLSKNLGPLEKEG